MPNALINKISKQTGQSKPKLEREWKAAKQEARKEHATNIYAYANSIVQKESHYKPKNSGEKK